MCEDSSQTSGYRFDDFIVDLRNRQIRHFGKVLPLTSRYFDVLVLLIRAGGDMVSKQRIFDTVWGEVIVTDAALTQCVKDIRKQLEDDAVHPRYIKTFPKHGYAFIGSVESIAEDSPDPQRLSSQRAMPPRPYKFLDYYTEQDAAIFFGREKEIEIIGSKILAHRSFLLYGRSGVGKSSILRAGLLPRLKAQGHIATVVRSFTDPVQQITSALQREFLKSNLSTDGVFVPERLARFEQLHANRRLIIILDQFEEFFSLLAENDRQHFFKFLETMTAAAGASLRVVFAVREDLLAEMSQAQPVLPEIFHHEYRLRRLSRDQAARAIIEPARAVGCRIETPLVDRILDDLGDGGIDPPQLQIICDALFDSKMPDASLTLADYENLGTASQILVGYLERVLRRFDAERFVAAKEILKAMISPDGQRLVLQGADVETGIRSKLKSAEKINITALIEELVGSRILRYRNQVGKGWLELAHDVLIPEVSRWLTAEDFALKRARGVIERAMQNYQTHQLLIDADALELLLPFGELLALTDDETDLLARSVLNRARTMPAWLVAKAPTLLELVEQAVQQDDPKIQLRVIEICALLRNEKSKQLLRQLALWNRHLAVRKAACIALADWLGRDAENLITASRHEAGLWRSTLSLALIRDYRKDLVWLSRKRVSVIFFVLIELAWWRLHQSGGIILRRGLGGAIGAAVAGALGGAMLGVGLTVARQATLFEAAPTIVVLINLGIAVGALGGLGVGFGMLTISQLSYRHSQWWSLVGGAVGGAAIGGSVNILGVDTFHALFGQNLIGMTGATEGAVIGLGVSLGAVLTEKLLRRVRSGLRVLGGALGAMCSGILLTFIGSNLFSGSLEIVARSFANSQISLDPLAPFFGEVHFGNTTQFVLGGLECLLFGTGIMAGIELARRFWR